MVYDPRTETGIPTEPVGSLPRPSRLQAAYADYDAGRITSDQLEAEQDEAVQDSIEHAGGDRRADHLRRRAALVELRDLRDHRHARRHRPGRQPGADGGQFFAIFADGHNRQLPRLTGGPFRYKTYAADTLKKSIRYATKPMKQAVIAPSMLALLYPLDEEVPGYPRERVRGGPGQRVREGHPPGVRGRRGARLDRLHRGAAGHPQRPAQPVDRARACCRTSSSSTTGCSTASRAEERVNIGIHTCPGGDRDSVHSADVPYSDLLPSMFKINAGYFLIQLASERDKDPVLQARSASTAATTPTAWRRWATSA